MLGRLGILTWFGLFFASPAVVPSIAHAYEEQATLDLAAGYLTGAASPTFSGHGPGVAVGAALGVGESLLVRGALGYGALFEDGHPRHLGSARVEAAYLLDIVRWVPFAGLGASLWLFEAEPRVAARAGAHLLVGVDFLATRTASLGLDVRVGAVRAVHDWALATEAHLRYSRIFELF